MKLSNLFPLVLITCTFLSVNDVQSLPAPDDIYEQPVPKAIRKIVKEISKANVFVLHPPEKVTPLINGVEENYFLLSKLATTEELIDLIGTHKNAVVRLYAFKALTTQLHNIPSSVMDIINNDTATITCINRDKNEKVELKILAQNFLN